MCLHTLIGPCVQPDVLATSYYPQACRDPRGGGDRGREMGVLVCTYNGDFISYHIIMASIGIFTPLAK